MIPMEPNWRSRLHSAVLQIESLLGPSIGFCQGEVISTPEPHDRNAGFKHELIVIVDRLRDRCLAAMGNLDVPLDDIAFDESMFERIQEILSDDPQRDAYIELADAIESAKWHLSNPCRISLTQ